MHGSAGMMWLGGWVGGWVSLFDRFIESKIFI